MDGCLALGSKGQEGMEMEGNGTEREEEKKGWVGLGRKERKCQERKGKLENKKERKKEKERRGRLKKGDDTNKQQTNKSKEGERKLKQKDDSAQKHPCFTRRQKK